MLSAITTVREWLKSKYRGVVYSNFISEFILCMLHALMLLVLSASQYRQTLEKSNKGTGKGINREHRPMRIEDGMFLNKVAQLTASAKSL